MVNPQRIADVMGLKKRVRSLGDLSEIVSHGVAKSAVRRIAERVAGDPKEEREVMGRLIPPATYKRRKNLLKPDESERAERLARVIATSEYVWEDEENARRFLKSPHPELGGRTPLDASYTELGARRVEELLWKLFYGLPA